MRSISNGVRDIMIKIEKNPPPPHMGICEKLDSNSVKTPCFFRSFIFFFLRYRVPPSTSLMQDPRSLSWSSDEKENFPSTDVIEIWSGDWSREIYEDEEKENARCQSFHCPFPPLFCLLLSFVHYSAPFAIP